MCVLYPFGDFSPLEFSVLSAPASRHTNKQDARLVAGHLTSQENSTSPAAQRLENKTTSQKPGSQFRVQVPHGTERSPRKNPISTTKVFN